MCRVADCPSLLLSRNYNQDTDEEEDEEDSEEEESEEDEEDEEENDYKAMGHSCECRSPGSKGRFTGVATRGVFLGAERRE